MQVWCCKTHRCRLSAMTWATRITVLICLASWAISASAVTKVRGVVFDPTGTPVPGALVRALPRPGEWEGNGIVGSFKETWVETNAQGEFSLDLAPGKYRIQAKDEAHGYPNPVFALCSDPSADFPIVAVGSSGLSNVRVVLGNQGGILAGQVYDRIRLQLIAHAKIRISDTYDPKSYVEIFTDQRGGFQFTVPNKSLTVSTTASGDLSAQIVSGAALTVAPGKLRTLLIRPAHRD